MKNREPLWVSQPAPYIATAKTGWISTGFRGEFYNSVLLPDPQIVKTSSAYRSYVLLLQMFKIECGIWKEIFHLFMCTCTLTFHELLRLCGRFYLFPLFYSINDSLYFALFPTPRLASAAIHIHPESFKCWNLDKFTSHPTSAIFLSCTQLINTISLINYKCSTAVI